MKIRIAYGKKGLEFNLPDRAGIDIDIIEPKYENGLTDQRAAVSKALNNPVASPPLKDVVNDGTKVHFYSHNLLSKGY